MSAFCEAALTPGASVWGLMPEMMFADLNKSSQIRSGKNASSGYNTFTPRVKHAPRSTTTKGSEHEDQPLCRVCRRTHAVR
jgi:hypothetical protein